MSSAEKYEFTLTLIGEEGSDNISCATHFVPRLKLQEVEKNHIVNVIGVYLLQVAALMKHPEFEEELSDLIERFSGCVEAEDKEADV